VVSISVRVWIGIQKMLAMPGVFSLAFISARIFSHVMPGRHWSCGLSVTTVSNIESGAGSVGGLGLARLAEDAFHLGNFVQQAVLQLEDARRLVDRHAGHRGGHEKDGALVQRRHELAAELPAGINRRGQDERGQEEREPPEAEHEMDERL